LERRGLICRCPEGRTQRLSLTPAGRELYDAVVPEQERFVAIRMAALTGEELRHLHELLQKLDRSLT
jgi:DNA-binding MarR family transcriptional regulator